jgi:hypothetical protein
MVTGKEPLLPLFPVHKLPSMAFNPLSGTDVEYPFQ